MKVFKRLKIILLLSYLLWLNILNCGGFVEGTLVATKWGLMPIEQLCKQDKIIVPNDNLMSDEFAIVDVSDFLINEYIKIGFSGECICVVPDQKFYLFDQCIWISARDLRLFDSLMSWNGECVRIESIQNIYQQQRVYKLSIQKQHKFCVSSQYLIVHNCEPVTATAITTTMAVLCPPAAPVIAIGEIIVGIIAGIGIYSAYKSSKKSKQHANLMQENWNSCNSNSGNWHDPEDDGKDIFKAIKLKADKKLRHRRFGNFYRDPKTKLWWSKDRAGHGGSMFKVFKENSKGLEWFFDADALGNQIIGKNKGPIGLLIAYKELIVCP